MKILGIRIGITIAIYLGLFIYWESVMLVSQYDPHPHLHPDWHERMYSHPFNQPVTP